MDVGTIVDIVIAAIMVLSVIYGVYHGFLQTVLSVLCCVLSLFLAAQTGPLLSSALQKNEAITSLLSTGTDAFAKVEDYDLANLSVSEGMDELTLTRILNSVSLPQPLKNLLQSNLKEVSFRNLNLNTVNEYVQRTIVITAFNVGSYIISFAVIYFVLALLCSLIKHVFKLPLLRAFDWLAGGVFGFARGVVIIYVLFLIVPVINTVLPAEYNLMEMISQSHFGSYFMSDGFFARMISGH